MSRTPARCYWVDGALVRGEGTPSPEAAAAIRQVIAAARSLLERDALSCPACHNEGGADEESRCPVCGCLGAAHDGVGSS